MCPELPHFFRIRVACRLANLAIAPRTERKPMLCSAFSRLLGTAYGVSGALMLAVVATLPAANAQTQPTAPITGVWIDHTGRGAVEIHTCGNLLCGRIAWVKDGNDAKGGPAKDKKGRPLCGLQIIGNLKAGSNGIWQDGWIYDPDKDDTFNVELQMKGARPAAGDGLHGHEVPERDATCGSAHPNRSPVAPCPALPELRLIELFLPRGRVNQPWRLSCCALPQPSLPQLRCDRQTRCCARPRCGAADRA